MHSMHSMHQQTDGFGHIFVIHSFIEQFNNYVFALLGGGVSFTTYGGGQARGQIRATAASLHHSHSNARSKPRLQPTPQLMVIPDP